MVKNSTDKSEMTRRLRWCSVEICVDILKIHGPREIKFFDGRTNENDNFFDCIFYY